ncbi:MAG: hypothetical protein AAFY36_06305 [Bacteroidota bacterium]
MKDSLLTIALFLGMAYLLFKIGRTIYLTRTTHADDEDLEDYWNGHLEAENPAGYKQLREHLGTCETCRDRLSEIIAEGKTRYREEGPIMTRRKF